MTPRISLDEPEAPPLERFVRDYAETAGGAWDEIEPQVYDLLLPSDLPGGDSSGVLRLAFDPEAIPEHPGAQLATLGAPVIDRMLADAVERGRFAELYLVGLNCHPHGLPARIASAVRIGPDLTLAPRQARIMQFPQALFWFEASFVSDQKEQELLCVGIDLHYKRQVRHTEMLLQPGRLAEAPPEPLPEAPHAPLRTAYLAARERVARTVTSLANSRKRELEGRLQKQSARMTRYYLQLGEELAEQARRAGPQDAGKHAARIEALGREQRLRLAELHAKGTLTVRARLLSVVIIRQPKLLIRAVLAGKNNRSGQIDLVWDPLIESVEAPQCPSCRQSTYDLSLHRGGNVICGNCSKAGRR